MSRTPRRAEVPASPAVVAGPRAVPTLNAFPPEVILWGGTGQAKVMRPIIESFGARVVAVFDDTPGLPRPFPDVPLYQGRAGLEAWLGDRDPSQVGFTVAIGNPHGRVRLRIADELAARGLVDVTVAHPSAVIAPNSSIAAGCQIHPGAIVMPESRIGRQCILNTKSSVDHECVLGDGVELGPGATLCGSIRVGAGAWIGAGATVLPRIRIGEDAIVGAGALVNRDVPAGLTCVGVPARPIVRKGPPHA